LVLSAQGGVDRISKKYMADEEILEPRGYILNRGTIGEGAYSKVRSAFSRKINQDCAIKCIDKRNAPDDFVQKFLPRELEILPKLNHKNIIRVYEILAVSDGRVYIVMDFGKKGDLLRYIQLGSATRVFRVWSHFLKRKHLLSFYIFMGFMIF